MWFLNKNSKNLGGGVLADWSLKTKRLMTIFSLLCCLKVNEDYEPVQVSSYDDNMRRWLKYYPLHRFHFVENKDLEENPLAGKKEIIYYVLSGKHQNTKSIQFTRFLAWYFLLHKKGTSQEIIVNRINR